MSETLWGPECMNSGDQRTWTSYVQESRSQCWNACVCPLRHVVPFAPTVFVARLAGQCWAPLQLPKHRAVAVNKVWISSIACPWVARSDLRHLSEPQSQQMAVRTSFHARAALKRREHHL